MNQDFANDRELVVGSFKTLRAFNDTAGKGLMSLNGSGPWEVGKLYTAKCVAGYTKPPWKSSTTMTKKYGTGSELWCPPKGHPYQKFQVSVPKTPYVIEIGHSEASVYLEEEMELNKPPEEGGKHVAPVGDCTCGFYSFYSQEVMTGGGARYVANGGGHAVAVIENTGIVIHGSLGIRSEKMKILGVTGRTHDSVNALLEEFPLDVYEG